MTMNKKQQAVVVVVKCSYELYVFTQPFSSNPTLQLSQWEAVDNTWHLLAFATRAHVGCCKAPLLSTGCTVA